MTKPEFQAVDLDQLPPEQVFNYLLEQAIQLKASDLFLFCNERSITAAARQWGRQVELAELSPFKGQHVINYVKTAAALDIVEKRRPLDGRMIHRMPTRSIDLRLSCIPTLYGEDLAMRLMDREMSLKPLDELGMHRRDLEQLKSMLESPSGLILVTGPTGTGKSTTLYACLQYLNDGRRKINTLEDPIEFAVAGFRQSQINVKQGLDFSELLRHVLRQSPDVIMIGEIRDEETATTAVRAANSGHLVFATLHASQAAAAVNSMLTRGVGASFLASCLLGVVAQRLLRELCPLCRVAYELPAADRVFEEIKDLYTPPAEQFFFGPEGCEQCRGAGYSGRTGLFEVMTVNRQLRQSIADGRAAQELYEQAIEQGMLEFRRGALLKVAQGVTSLEEVLSTVSVEHLGLED